MRAIIINIIIAWTMEWHVKKSNILITQIVDEDRFASLRFGWVLFFCRPASVCVFVSGILCKTSDTFISNGIMSTACMDTDGLLFVFATIHTQSVLPYPFHDIYVSMFYHYSRFQHSLFSTRRCACVCIACNISGTQNVPYCMHSTMLQREKRDTRTAYFFVLILHLLPKSVFFNSYPTWLVYSSCAFPTLW